MPDISIEHLLDRASASLPTAPGAPRQADLRRAVSDAYYALFHKLTEATANQALRNVDLSAVRQYRRSLSHAEMKKVCQAVATGKGKLSPAQLANHARQSPTVRTVAQSFVDLQEERHTADYDHQDVFDAKRLKVAIAAAKNAIGLVEGLKTDPSMCAFVGILALRSSWSSPGSS